MVQYSLAVATLVGVILSSADGSFVSSSHSKIRQSPYEMRSMENKIKANRSTTTRAFETSSWRRQQRLSVLSVSAAFDNERDNNKNNNVISNSFLKSNHNDSQGDNGQDEYVDEYEMEMQRRKEARAAYALLSPNGSAGSNDGTVTRVNTADGRKPIRYEIQLPLLVTGGTSLWKPVEGVKTLAAPDDTWISQRIAMSLKEVTSSGELSELALDLDSLQYQTLMEETIRDTQRPTPSEGAGSVQLLNKDKFGTTSKPGLIVSSVVRGGLAWNAGVRAGDQLLASSATIGEKLWAKSTLEGVRSAVSSRKVMSSKISFELQRPMPHPSQSTMANFVTEEYTIKLARPMGINVEDTEEGFVRVTGLTDQALESTRKLIQPGDRVVAVNSSFGKKMWPVSSVEGLVSACTTRLPGQPVTLRLERLVARNDSDSALSNSAYSEASQGDVDTADSLLKSKTNLVKTTTTTSNASSSKTGVTSADGSESQRMLLLSRCGDILKRYISVYNPSSTEKERIVAVPSLVADRVLDAIADASISMDAKTLTLLMNAYLICGKEDEAIRVFQASTGLSPNGDPTTTTDVIIKSKKNEGCQLMTDSDTLDLYSATALLRAHAMKKDCLTAYTILMAMRGDNSINDDNAWGKQTSAQLKPDIRCYNIVLAAAARAGGQRNLSIAHDLFESLSDASTVLNTKNLPRKDVVTYNTMIAAYANAGRRQDAYTIFNSMRKADIMPDKFTTTSLIKACINDCDLETAKTLLKNMRRANIEVDLYAYNTMIKALCDNMKWYEAKELVTEMEFRGVKPDGMTYGLLMNGLLKAGQPGPCLTLFEAACADQSTTALTENVKLYTTAVTAAATLGDYERALELVSRMRFSGIQPNIKTLTSLMGACISAKRSDLALEVFKKIKNPDGYCQSLAFRAYCDAEDFDSAKQILLRKEDDKKQQLSGKHFMSSYRYILHTSLQKGRYDTAKEAMALLLGAGFIPSKNIYRAMLDGLDLLPKKGSGGKFAAISSVKDNEEKFDFLISILDMVDARNLLLDCDLYVALLNEGSRLGGLRRKIASFVAERRSDSMNDSNQIEKNYKDMDRSNRTKISWQSLIENYSEYRERLDDFILPTIRLRSGERDIRLILAAEKGVVYLNNRQKSIARKRKRS